MKLIGPLEIIGIIFVALKLFGAIAWSWWWVCSPFIVSFAIGVILGVIAMGVGLSQGKSIGEIRENVMKGLSGRM